MAKTSVDPDEFRGVLNFDNSFEVEPFDPIPDWQKETPYDGDDLSQWMDQVDVELEALEAEEQDSIPAGDGGNTSGKTSRGPERFSYTSETTITQKRYIAKLNEWRDKLKGFLTDWTAERSNEHQGQTSSPKTLPTFGDFRNSLQVEDRRVFDTAVKRGSIAISRPNTARITEEGPDQPEVTDKSE